MNKKIIIAVLVVLVVVGGVVWKLFLNKQTVTEVNTKLPREEIVVSKKGNKIYLDSGDKSVSMVNLSIEGVSSFVADKSGFNSEFKNVVEGGVLELSLGAMKSTADLPKGEILLGTVQATGALKLIKGVVTMPGLGGAKASDFKLTPSTISDTK